MIEDQERCLKCGTQEGLQGVAVTIGRKTFHLFYLCSKCGTVGIEQLLQIIDLYKGKKPDSNDDP
jgi:transcription elongation factor Elf1